MFSCILFMRLLFRFDRFIQHIALRSGRMQSSDELEKLRSKIEKYEEQLEKTTDPANQTAMLTMLAAMRQKEVMLMQGEQTSWLRKSWVHGIDLAVNPRPCKLPLSVSKHSPVFLTTCRDGWRRRRRWQWWR